MYSFDERAARERAANEVQSGALAALGGREKRNSVGIRKLHLEMFRCLHFGGRIAHSRRVSVLRNARVSTKRNTNPRLTREPDGELKVKKRREWKERSENGQRTNKKAISERVSCRIGTRQTLSMHIWPSSRYCLLLSHKREIMLTPSERETRSGGPSARQCRR